MLDEKFKHIAPNFVKFTIMKTQNSCVYQLINLSTIQFIATLYFDCPLKFPRLCQNRPGQLLGRN